MAQSVIIKITDDLGGGDADETISFALDGKAYQIDLNKKNASEFRKTLKPYIDAGRLSSRSGSRRRNASPTTSVTRFSQLESEEKRRFRNWANLPDARRIADSRVEEWLRAGKP